jgi:hypothetical protein
LWGSDEGGVGVDEDDDEIENQSRRSQVHVTRILGTDETMLRTRFK